MNGEGRMAGGDGDGDSHKENSQYSHRQFTRTRVCRGQNHPPLGTLPSRRGDEGANKKRLYEQT